MSAKPKPQTTEIDHIRNTLTDMVDGLGQTRGEMHQRFDQQDQKIDANQQENRESQQENRERFDRQDKEIAAIKEMLQALLSRQ